MRRENQEYHCVICFQFKHKSTAAMRNHIEAKHFPDMFTHECFHCKAILNTRSALDSHKRKCSANLGYK